MANCSIPNSSPASGRISTRSRRRSRKQNSQPRASVSVIRRSVFRLQGRRQVCHLESVRWRTAAFRSGTAARKIQSAICNRQSAIRRVKGAWWPSRSSKPSSLRKWRGRFDSYPLRLFIFDFRLPIADCHVATALRAVQERRR
jgi:hypothetical protein